MLVLLVLSGTLALASAESGSMKVKITTDKSAYIKGDKIRIYVHAKDMNGSAVGNALVQVALAHSGKSYAFDRKFTDVDGVATFTARLSTRMSSGEYVIFAIVSKLGFDAGVGTGKFKIF
jgi:hypothetical protein